ncbi:MFS transporter [Kribbella antiqua]|uniref:MFS transporter n=1 Tax=Kribbella antiqua TaxID=2512217 RepID=A0A4R2IGP9_9ACTN|nr:MFS transporter [Kribbella antiqua]TCO43933.1 MFS transporter [Kribbella antiqua]
MRAFTGNTATRAGGWAIVCVAQFVVVLDTTVVTTALPAIDDDLEFGAVGLLWVFTAYTTVLAGLLILGGRAADLIGSRRLFRIGLAVFSLASLACATAWSPAALISSRLVQGLGAALLAPAALAALSDSLPKEAARRALGWWTAAGAAGGASGWVLGGVLTQLGGWRWVFAVNLPIGVVALALSRRSLPGRGSTTRVRSLDLPGACSVTAGIALTALGLSELAHDPSTWRGWAALAAAAPVLALFVRIERRSPQPLLPGSLARTPGVLGGNLTAAAITASTAPPMISVALYVQNTLQLPPAQAGLVFPAFNLAVIGGSLVGPNAALRAGVRRMLVTGFIGIAAGAALLLLLPKDGLPLALVLTAFTLMGLSLGLASVSSTTAGTAEVVEGQRGVAAGVLTSSAQLGTTLGLALSAPVTAATEMHGYRLGFLTGVAIALAGAVAALTVPRAVRRTTAAQGLG